MSTMPFDSFSPAARPKHAADGVPAAVRTQNHVAGRWSALHEAAAVVGALAGQPLAAPDSAILAFPEAMAQAGGQRLALAGRAIDDVALMLEAGIRALLAVHARGASPQVPARALSAEFRDARDAILALAPHEQRRLG